MKDKEFKRPYVTDYSGNGGMWKGHCLTAQGAMKAAFARVIEQGDRATVTNRTIGKDIARMHPIVSAGMTVGVYVWAYANVVSKPRKTKVKVERNADGKVIKLRRVA